LVLKARQQLEEIRAAGTFKVERQIITPQAASVGVLDVAQPVLNFCEYTAATAVVSRKHACMVHCLSVLLDMERRTKGMNRCSDTLLGATTMHASEHASRGWECSASHGSTGMACTLLGGPPLAQWHAMFICAVLV
jgi:hypothetical protein